MKLPDKKRETINNHSTGKNKTGIKQAQNNNPSIPSVNKQRKRPPGIFYLILAIIPILFFVILETGLRLFNYGINNQQWVNVTDELLTINPEIARRYFYNTVNIPTTIQDVFDKDKKADAFRIFVLGGSSAAGYPYMPIGSFSRYLQKRLELVYPDSKIEVVNIAMTAVNSYTLRDLFPGVLEQQPDLVIIYAGHNEYYGALGVGSAESLGSSRNLVNTALYLNRFKTFELLRNIIKGASGIISNGSKPNTDGTLMSRIVKEQYIPFNSQKFKAGISQFEGNISDILEMAREKSTPLIMGTLVSNLKDQPPFISVTENNIPSANDIFNQAQELLKQGQSEKAGALFRRAKDFDALRFRAPEEINKIIFELGKEFNCSIVDIDSAFSAESPGGITGNSLMTDHLHPNLKGYQLIGKLYYEMMDRINILPKTKKTINNNTIQDSLTLSNYNFSGLDSTIADFRIKYLKNDWPFVEKDKVKQPHELLKVINLLDTTAVEVVDGTLEWEKAHRRIAGWYLHNKDLNNFRKQMNVLISQYPFVTEYYDFTANELLKFKEYDMAYDFLFRRYKVKPDAFSTKWLGIISLSKGNTENAINYLEESKKFNNRDTQVLYNLSGAYSLKKEYSKALNTINLCLSIDPDYTGANVLRKQLAALIQK